MMAKRKSRAMGYGTTEFKVIEVDIIPGAVVVDTEKRAIEVLMMMEEATAAIAPVQQFLGQARTQVTGFMRTHAVDTVQLDGRYYRLIQGESTTLVATPEQMPADPPKGAKSVKEIVKGIRIKDGKKEMPLWNFLTRRVLDPKKLDLAISRGYITDKKIAPAFITTDRSPYIRAFDGEVEKDG